MAKATHRCRSLGIRRQCQIIACALPQAIGTRAEKESTDINII
jgi:hypothetical protein